MPTGQVVMATVLVVEDETLIRELVAEELEEVGYAVIVANNAHQAIAILEASGHPPGIRISTCQVLWTG
jgi:CheY-like chemotaxis protein